MRHGLIGTLFAITAAGLLFDPSASMMVASVLLFALVAVACVHSFGTAEVPGLARAAREELVRTYRPARQCDPDAAGHIRPRAPGLPA